MPAPTVIDADFEVIRAPLRPGDRHPTRRGWVFTGMYDADGYPLFYNRLLDPGFWYRNVARILWGIFWTIVGVSGTLMLISGVFLGAFK